jgi:hypothetical protein
VLDRELPSPCFELIERQRCMAACEVIVGVRCRAVKR